MNQLDAAIKLKLVLHIKDIEDYLILLLDQDRKIKSYELRQFTYKFGTEIWCDGIKIR